jgi:tRNA (guanine37-N1)-methyltransferase
LPLFDSITTSFDGIQVVPYELPLEYENFNVEEVLRRILPPDIEIPSSFEQIGHIAHVNLRPEVLEYKHIIGQVIMDKSPVIKTVVNKIGNIENEFRTFPMEVLAGDANFKVIIKESNAKFTFDFSKVYWNSRLQMVSGI